MPEFIVQVARMETIAFRIEADDEEDAQARYLMDGDEVQSDTNRLEILGVMTHEQWEQQGAPTMRRDDDGNTFTRL